jgi:hypothetical protein
VCERGISRALTDSVFVRACAQAQQITFYLSVDSAADVYFNGNFAFHDANAQNEMFYWNDVYPVHINDLVVGANVIAVHYNNVAGTGM